MAKIVKPHPLSFSSVFLEPYFNDLQLGIATGFFWSTNYVTYLVTNYHVLSGINPYTNQPINQYGSLPNKLKIWLHLSGNLGSWEAHEISLLDENDNSLWKVHKDFGSTVDVSIIEVEAPEKLRVFPINNITFTDFREEISQDVFIIGFPKGITGAGKFPIWKRGSIASEPDIDLDNKPQILIDSMTREGMSGSPVITQYVGYYGKDPDNPKGTDWFGMGRKFLGVYSGRLTGRDEFEAHLGIIWKATLIDQIIESGT